MRCLPANTAMKSKTFEAVFKGFCLKVVECRAYLWALDATLPEPFLARHPNGSLRNSPVEDGDAEGTLEVVEMDLFDTDDEEGSSNGSSAVSLTP